MSSSKQQQQAKAASGEGSEKNSEGVKKDEKNQNSASLYEALGVKKNANDGKAI
jgi:hypothetical protein